MHYQCMFYLECEVRPEEELWGGDMTDKVESVTMTQVFQHGVSRLVKSLLKYGVGIGFVTKVMLSSYLRVGHTCNALSVHVLS